MYDWSWIWDFNHALPICHGSFSSGPVVEKRKGASLVVPPMTTVDARFTTVQIQKTRLLASPFSPKTPSVCKPSHEPILSFSRHFPLLFEQHYISEHQYAIDSMINNRSRQLSKIRKWLPELLHEMFRRSSTNCLPIKPNFAKYI